MQIKELLSRVQQENIIDDFQMQQFESPPQPVQHSKKQIPEYNSQVMKPQENMKLNTLSMSMRSQTRTSKTILNENAQKFKLSKLETNVIRYECIYKNLLRDVRKVFTVLFNNQTQYQSAKKKIINVSYFQFVKEFLIGIFGQEKLNTL